MYFPLAVSGSFNCVTNFSLKSVILRLQRGKVFSPYPFDTFRLILYTDRYTDGKSRFGTDALSNLQCIGKYIPIDTFPYDAYGIIHTMFPLAPAPMDTKLQLDITSCGRPFRYQQRRFGRGYHYHNGFRLHFFCAICTNIQQKKNPSLVASPF